MHQQDRSNKNCEQHVNNFFKGGQVGPNLGKVKTPDKAPGKQGAYQKYPKAPKEDNFFDFYHQLRQLPPIDPAPLWR